MITSVHNDKIKLVKALQETTKTRRKEELIVLEGMRLVRDALMGGHKPAFLLTTSGFHDATVSSLIRAAGIEAIEVDEAVMQHVSDTRQPQGILGVFPMPKAALPDHLQRILILDSIRDPGNLGTILRTAAAAGVDAVLLSPTCADPYNPKVLRGGMGAHFRVAVANMEWEHIEQLCSGKTVYMADGTGETLYDQADWSKDWALIIGSEAHGAGDAARHLTSTHIRIPMAADTESLNAAIAVGIILFEAQKHPLKGE
ncbi:MAG: RNA methyltransferase [Anaerolineaceae bacterium]|nr:RNA methyltransferase [Anaerolineaceae bacterium]